MRTTWVGSWLAARTAGVVGKGATSVDAVVASGEPVVGGGLVVDGGAVVNDDTVVDDGLEVDGELGTVVGALTEVGSPALSAMPRPAPSATPAAMATAMTGPRREPISAMAAGLLGSGHGDKR